MEDVDPHTTVFERARSLHGQGQMDAARALYEQVLADAPEHADAMHLLGVLLAQGSEVQEVERGVQLLQASLALLPGRATMWLNLGVALRKQGQYERAIEAFERVLQLMPEHKQALYELAQCALSLGQTQQALHRLDALVALDDDYQDAQILHGNALFSLKRHAQARSSFERYLQHHPDTAVAWYNLGSCYLSEQQYPQAMAAFDRALQLNPRMVLIYINRAVTLMALHRPQEAQQLLEQGLEIDPAQPQLLSNLISLHFHNKDYAQALALSERLYACAPTVPMVQGHRLHAQAHLADWRDWDQRLQTLLQALARGEDACMTFPLLSLSDDPALQLQAARRAVQRRYSPVPALPPLALPPPPGPQEGLRLAYVSASFHNHPVAHLMAGVLARHTQGGAQVWAIALSPERDAITERIAASVTHFVPAQDWNDVAVAQYCREQGIHIVVDLDGHTGTSRPGIFAHRAAPVQVNYLGYPGSMGAPYFDYIIGDRVVMPPEELGNYDEKVVWLPECFQAQDDQRNADAAGRTRAQEGLPEQGLVLAAFCATYKINPSTFACWMRLLTACPGSVLWLLSGSPEVQERLQKQAQAHGVAPERLVFAARTNPFVHLARLPLADLMLDTWPCAAGSTASDTLWMGVPLLTRMGRSYVSRMAGSLLLTLGLPELVTHSAEDYEARALALLQQPQALHDVRTRLTRARMDSPLFNTDRFTHHLEAAYRMMCQRVAAGLPPAHLEVPCLEQGGVPALLQQALAAHREGRHPEARAGYEAVLQAQPEHLDALHLLGVLLAQRGNESEVLQGLRYIEQSMALAPGKAMFEYNYALALQRAGHWADAVQAFDRTLALQPEAESPESDAAHFNAAHLWNSRGACLQVLRRHTEARDSYARALALNQAIAYARGAHAYQAAYLADWSQREADVQAVLQGLAQGERVTPPFEVMTFADAPVAQQQAARIWVEDKHPPQAVLGPLPRPQPQARIRLAYVSPDFGNHALSWLMAGVWRAHDRSRFEVWAVSLRDRPDDVMQQNLKAQGFEHFLDVSAWSERAVAEHLRGLQIDIAVDLAGHTSLPRPGIFAHRAAPVQVNYLGYPGTLGAPYMDYILGDKCLMPPDAHAHYDEKVVWLPECFQANDAHRLVASTVYQRADQGLPQEGVVFAALCGVFKINPSVFDVWMRLLQQVPGSVLWLLDDNAEAKRHLQHEAQVRGVAPERLVFAAKLPPHEHLARLPLADLFLDTWPCGAGTTASDAMHVGLPLLTCMGKQYASRMAGSLLLAMGLPELVTDHVQDYEARALTWATHPEQLAALRERVKQVRQDNPVYDTPRFTRHLEAAYRMMMARAWAGLEPAPLQVPVLEQLALTDPIAGAAPQVSMAEWFYQGCKWRSQGDTEQALACFEQSLALQPSFEAHYNAGNACMALLRWEDALAHFDAALLLQPQHAGTHTNRGNVLAELGRKDEVHASYAQALALDPDNVQALNNLGNACREVNQPEQALTYYERALAQLPAEDPQYNGVLRNRAQAYAQADRLHDAVQAYTELLARRPDDGTAWVDLAAVRLSLGQVSLAANDYERAMQIDPDIPFLPGYALHLDMYAARWKNWPARRNQLFEAVAAGKQACFPFPLMGLTDDAQLVQKAARVWMAHEVPESVHRVAAPVVTDASRRLRVAYVSPDFRSHAVSRLMMEVWAAHDRSRLEVWAVSLRQAPEDDWLWARLEKEGFEHILHAQHLSDEAVADRLRSLEIDIAVDLAGHTSHSRPGIFARRAAPVQVNYLGYPGTLGAPYMDYILGDKVLMPPESHPSYDEQVVWLPESFQANGRITMASGHVDRQQAGLPPEGFVFAAFCNWFKIVPEWFDIWMRLLHAVPGSVLWLLQQDEQAQQNLLREAHARGMTADRFVFAPQLVLDQHLRRLQLADLQLDTFPCGAGTTASDALWAGLPLLTRMGRSYPSRMAGSLLHVLGLPELVTDNDADYEARALMLATHPEQLRALRQRLAQAKEHSPVYQPQRFARHLESAFMQMAERARAGLPPKFMAIHALGPDHASAPQEDR